MTLSSRVAGFLVGRGLAFIFLSGAVAAFIGAVFLVPLYLSDFSRGLRAGRDGYRFEFVTLIGPCTLFLLGGLLWRNAERIGSRAANDSDSNPLNSRDTLLVTVFAISLYEFLSRIGDASLWLWFKFEPQAYDSFDRFRIFSRPTSASAFVVVIALAVMAFIVKPVWGRSKVSAARIISYPRLESDPEEPGETPLKGC